ncbi:type 2 isopentenyl-diphosphate Delta-isomerase [Leucobacter massiliensis]|uniref:Isopentenyl-diphosphate delta-isomerase n=1 Tax=Leucobacter massiliensis TaxID=1686285 RepID=A0A2S9QPB7_9MICO|nr:type 2 isopentenyl-diphosphate Delta-isomerase [Leucobacter massiliensis]PRI11422.1 type 2 isopentenyl-diphosphate Delta-isomerase [Leucobacter massiliensis]
MDAERAARKDDHVRLAREQRDEPRGRTDFDDLEFVHHALAGVDAERVELSVRLGEWHWPTPFYANGMTGGTEWTTRINRELAIAARETGMPMACGSVSVALDDAEAAGGFAVIREENPDGFVMANIGVGRDADDAVRAVELLRADALQLHLNAVQETAMPEGSRDFSGWERSVERIIAASPVPVIVKEVGFGLSRRTLRRLAELGAQFADVSGAGGTDFLRIENARHDSASRSAGGDFAMLSGFGQSALACLLDAPADGPRLLASGGVRNPFDVVKALAAGAGAVGVAGSFLQPLLAGGAEALVPLIERWIAQTTAILALLGAETPAALGSTDLLVRGRLAEYCRLRGIDLVALASRSGP